MTNKTITLEILKVVANGVEPHPVGFPWKIIRHGNGETHVMHGNNIGGTPVERIKVYNRDNDGVKLRIRDFLAEKGVSISKIECDGVKVFEATDSTWDYDGFEIQHENINDCAILAAYKIIKGGV